MSAISELKLDSGTPSKTSSSASNSQPLLGLAYLSDLRDLDFSAGLRNTDFAAGTDNLRNVTFADNLRNVDFQPVTESHDFTFKALKNEADPAPQPPTQSSASTRLPPSPANSTDSRSCSKLVQDDKASQTPATQSSVLPSVGLATPPSPVPRALARQVEAAAQTSLSPSRKRSHEEMEEEDFKTAPAMLDPTAAATATTTVTKETAVQFPDARPRKRRFLQRFGFTAGVVVGAASMFGTLLLLGEE